LEALKELGEATSWGILNKLGKTNPNYVRPRLTNLLKKKMVECGTGDILIMPLVKKVRQVEQGGRKQWVWKAIF